MRRSCYDESARTYVGQIGHPAIDHAYWGRAEDQTVERPAYVWDASMPASDLLSNTAAALASSSLVFKWVDPPYAARLLSTAKSLYTWAVSSEGSYSKFYKSATSPYPSSSYLDSQSWAACWMYRATGDAKYLQDAAGEFAQRRWGRFRDNAGKHMPSRAVRAPCCSVLEARAGSGRRVDQLGFPVRSHRHLHAPAAARRRCRARRQVVRWLL